MSRHDRSGQLPLAGGPDYGVHCTPEGAPSKLRLGGGFPRAWPTLSCVILLNITHAELKPAIYAAFLIDRGRAGLRGSGESRWPGAPSFRVLCGRVGGENATSTNAGIPDPFQHHLRPGKFHEHIDPLRTDHWRMAFDAKTASARC
jgi:hypothetical protein